MRLVLTSPPATEPLSVEDAKTQVNVDGAHFDGIIADMIASARDEAERTTGRSLITQTLALYMDTWPTDGFIRLPRGPVQSVTSVVYRHPDGTATTLAADQYQVSIAGPVARVAPAYGCSWPTLRGTMDDVVVTYVAGYGDADDVPAGIVSAVRMIFGAFYANREDFVTGTIATPLPLSSARLLGKFRLPFVIVPVNE